MQLLQTILAFVLAIGVLVVIHELGHYLVARWCGVKVLRFSFGFGRVLWSRRAGRDRTEWAICAIPLGGYVKMLDEREDEGIAQSELHRAFNRQPLGVRSLIVLAGPLANFLLAIVFYWLLFMSGQSELAPVIGRLQAESPAVHAGLQAGDRVLEADGKEVKTWLDLRWAVIGAVLDGQPLSLRVTQDGGGERRHDLDLSGLVIDERQPDPMLQAGLLPPLPRVAAVVGKLVPGAPAERAGILPGDRILAVDGQTVRYFHEFADIVGERAGQTVAVRLERAGREQVLDVSVEPVAGTQPLRGRVGLSVLPDETAGNEFMIEVRHGPIDAMLRALDSTWNTTLFSLKVMWRMIRGDVSLSNVSGPLTIADYAGKTAKAGIEPYINFLALISISIGVLNLLPVPLLDGGHLLYHALEFIRGKPLSDHLMEMGQRVGLVLLGCLMLLAFFNDINRQFSGLG